MPIDKRIPRVLNSDLDNKAIDKVSMLDALNLYSGPDNEGFGVDGSKSDAGDQILKNIKGNVRVSEQEGFIGTPRLIGSVEDPKTDITYLFIHSTQAAGQGIWAYDRYGRLPGSQPNSLRLIYRSKQFNFPANGFVKADIVYTNAIQTFPDLGVDFDKDAIIYFTDGKNEPRKINAYRAFNAGSDIHGTDVYAEADFITACPKTPVKPITFSFGFDSSRSTSNFTTTPGFQFAYQYVYIDGMESAISPYSDVAFPPSVVFQGAEPFANHNNYNVCNLSIPDLGPEISSVKILARQGSTGSFLIIDEIEKEDFDGSYAFHNDRIGTGISENEVNKQFDSVPRKAVTQGVSSNRLMYGNYTDGFDAVKTQCSAKVIYREAPESFLTYDVKINPSIEPIGPAGTNQGKSVGFYLDFSGMPSTLPEGAELSLNLTIAPDRNWHTYRFVSGQSYQQTRQRGYQTQEGIDDLYNNVNFQQSFAESSESSGSTFLESSARYFGDNSGVTPPTQRWVTSDTTEEGGFTGTSGYTAYGTSAANPLILKGGAVSFYAKIRTTEEINEQTQLRINNAFHKALLESEEGEQGFTWDQQEDVQSKDYYDLDVGLFSGKRIKQDRIKSGSNNTDPEARLIIGVDVSPLEGVPVNPGGYFIINKARVNMSLKEVDYNHYQLPAFVSTTASHFRLSLDSVNDADIYTCLHATVDNEEDFHSSEWIAISRNDVSQLGVSMSISDWLSSKGINDGLQFHLNPVPIGEAGSFGQIQERQIGYLKELPIFLEGEEFCLMDGEGGPGGGPSYGFNNDSNSYDYWKLYNQGSVTVNPTISGGVNQYSQTVFYTGEIGPFANEGVSINQSPAATTIPLLFKTGVGGSGFDPIDVYEYVLPDALEGNEDVIDPAKPNFKRLQSPAEIVSESFAISNFDELDQRSFKTEANHDFGIVYYDERGRHGFVNPLTTVFVQGYTNAERPDGGKGRVEIKLILNHEPPSWAHQYKIVYSKNTTVQDFVQYTAGGGFVSQNLELQEVSETNQNIYVSLNYLQGHPVSYVSSFGARTPEGGLNFYKFQEGDKLRVISYFEGEERNYVDYEFDVVDLVKLGVDGNPLDDDGENVPENLKGDFVVIKNNPTAFGFTYGETLSGAAKWGNNCIIELRTPLKDVDADQRIFYEMSETYNVVIDANDNIVHDQEELTLKNGDVWFRPVATNVREYENGEYVDLIPDTDGSGDPPPQPNFKNVFLETSTATDLFRGDNLGLGRPNFVLKDAKETVREATITYSDPSNPEGKRLNYSSFNASLANFKDLPERFGGIQYMSDYDEFLFVLQEDKVSVVPVNKNILSDASGSNMVIASTEILGKAVFYPGQNGCDDDPSSVFDSGQEAYFCNKTLSKVYRWTKQGGVEEISDAGMSSVIRASIQRAINENGEVRIVGGYDPLKEEYLFTILKPVTRPTPSGVEYVDQPDQIIQPDEGTGEEDGGDDPVVVVEAPEISVSPESISFGEVQQEDAGPSVFVEVFNGGSADLHVTDVKFSGTEFTLRGESNFYVSPTQSQSIEIVFDPSQSTGSVSGTAVIENNDTDISIPLLATVVEPPAAVLSEFQQSWNDFYETLDESLRPTEYPLTSDDQMSAELAFNYIHDLRVNNPEEITWGELRDFLSPFQGESIYMVASDAAVNANDNVGTAELLMFLSFFDTTFDEYTSLNVSESLFSAAVSVEAATIDPDLPIPLDGGGTPIPSPGLFDSTQDALDFLVSDASMTVAQFHFLNGLIKPKIKADFNGDGIVGTGDLMDLLQYYSFAIPSLGDPAFINPAEIELEGQTSSSDVNEALFWISQNGSDMTAEQYWNFTSNIRLDVKTDINGDGIVGTNDHMTILNEWTIEQAGEAATPLDPSTTAFI